MTIAVADFILAPDQTVTGRPVKATMTNKPAADVNQQIIGKNTGVSIAFVIVLISGVVANLMMFSSLKREVSVFGTHLENQTDDVREIKTSVKDLAHSTRSEIASLRERVTKIEAVLEKMK